MFSFQYVSEEEVVHLTVDGHSSVNSGYYDKPSMFFVLSLPRSYLDVLRSFQLDLCKVG